MKILAIETSADETAVAVVEAEKSEHSITFSVLGNALYSQAKAHAEYGGIYPTLAKREHQTNLPKLFDEAYAQANKPQLDLIAVTNGPGLEPALWQGIEFAKILVKKFKIPITGINHLEGHISAAFLEKKSDTEFSIVPPEFPVLSLLISGGHTELVAMKDWFEYELVGRTRDDAVGEAFDKVARLLGMPYPGGPEIAAAAKRAEMRSAEYDFTLPRPMINDDSCDFSFSGLKTAVLYLIRDMKGLSDTDKDDIALEFEEAARDVLIVKTKRALKLHNPKTLVVGGGVSANERIRKSMEELVGNYPGITLKYPGKGLTGDNAIMIGIAAYLRKTTGKTVQTEDIVARGTLSLA